MICRIYELKNRQVVCVEDGYVLGYIGDIELDTTNGRLVSIVIFGNLKAFGLLGKEKDIVIPFEDIKVIGNETVLVKTNSLKYIEKSEREC